jgi:hypothetical protein
MIDLAMEAATTPGDQRSVVNDFSMVVATTNDTGS